MLSTLLAVTAALPGGQPPPPEPVPVVERVSVFSVNVRLRRHGGVFARSSSGRAFTVPRAGDLWDDEPLSRQPLAPPQVHGLRGGARRPPRCGPGRARGRWAAYTPLRLSARGDGVSVTGVFAFARLSRARRLVPTGLTQQIEACGSVQAEAVDGTRPETVGSVITARAEKPILIGEQWGDERRGGAVARGFVLRGRALAAEGVLSGGVGPLAIPRTGIDRYADNQVYGIWDAGADAGPGPGGTVVLGLYERPRRAPLPRFTLQLVVATR